MSIGKILTIIILMQVASNSFWIYFVFALPPVLVPALVSSLLLVLMLVDYIMDNWR